jgi:hypothetical protein
MRAFPNSTLRPKMLLLKGFIFEKAFALPDSAISAYSLLVKLFPDSEEAKSIQEKLKLALQAKAAKADSLSAPVKGTNHRIGSEKKMQH